MPVCRPTCYRLEPASVHYVRFVLEGYDGLATITTLDPAAGLVRLSIPPGCEASAHKLMSALAHEVRLEPVGCQGIEGEGT